MDVIFYQLPTQQIAVPFLMCHVMIHGRRLLSDYTLLLSGLNKTHIRLALTPSKHNFERGVVSRLTPLYVSLLYLLKVSKSHTRPPGQLASGGKCRCATCPFRRARLAV